MLRITDAIPAHRAEGRVLTMHLFTADPVTAVVLLCAAFLAGLIDSIAGGGGLITLPALLSVGLPPHLALGTNKLAGTFGTFSATRIYVRKGIFRPARWRHAITATFVGALLGAAATRLFSAALLNKLLPLIILAAGAYALWRRPTPTPTTPSGTACRPGGTASVMLGSLLGFYDGFSGPGTGVFWTTLAMKVFKADLVSASGIARAMNFVSNVVALLTFAVLNSVNYALGLSMGIAVMVGASIGARSAIRYGRALIRPIFLAVVIGLAARLAWLEWF